MDRCKLAKRESNLDVLRIVALFSVISVHFFLNNGFYGAIVSGKRMYIMVLMRTLFMDCVPLFIVLTGYLMNRKVLCAKYYYGVIKTVEIYVLASLACTIYSTVVLHDAVSLKDFIINIFDFEAAPYSWYIEMYFGLFLIIPFLNVLYHGLKTKKEKTILILTLTVLTSFPGVINIRYNILPNWWRNFYPITYYFIGCYICEFKVHIKRSVNVLILCIHIIIAGSLNYHLSSGRDFYWGVWQEWGSIFNVITTILVFLLIIGIKTDRWSVRTKGFLKYISGLCLGGYLCSWIMDSIVYPRFNAMVPVMRERLDYYLPVVLVVFIGSLILSGILNAFCTLADHIAELGKSKTNAKEPV